MVIWFDSSNQIGQPIPAMPASRPLVAAALVCEKILTEKDNVSSAIRIVDTFYLNESPQLSDEMPVGVNMNLLLMLKSQNPIPSGEVSMKMRTPSAQTKDLPNKYTLTIKGGEAGSALHIAFVVALKEYGLFWFDILWNGEVLTSVPFRLASGQKPAEAPQAG